MDRVSGRRVAMIILIPMLEDTKMIKNMDKVLLDGRLDRGM